MCSPTYWLRCHDFQAFVLLTKLLDPPVTPWFELPSWVPVPQTSISCPDPRSDHLFPKQTFDLLSHFPGTKDKSPLNSSLNIWLAPSSVQSTSLYFTRNTAWLQLRKQTPFGDLKTLQISESPTQWDKVANLSQFAKDFPSVGTKRLASQEMSQLQANQMVGHPIGRCLLWGWQEQTPGKRVAMPIKYLHFEYWGGGTRSKYILATP